MSRVLGGNGVIGLGKSVIGRDRQWRRAGIMRDVCGVRKHRDIQLVVEAELSLLVVVRPLNVMANRLPPVLRDGIMYPMVHAAVAEQPSHVVVLLLQPFVLLLELAYLDERRGEGGDLVWVEAECCLEFGDGFLELLNVCLSLRAVASLCARVTTAL